MSDKLNTYLDALDDKAPLGKGSVDEVFKCKCGSRECTGKIMGNTIVRTCTKCGARYERFCFPSGKQQSKPFKFRDGIRLNKQKQWGEVEKDAR